MSFEYLELTLMIPNGSMTIVKFIYGNDFARFKIHLSQLKKSTESTVRWRFNIPADASYNMLDATDGTSVPFFWLWRLENESIVHIELQKANARTDDPSAVDT